MNAGLPPARRQSRFAVATIVIAQLLGTSLWFSANGAGTHLTAAWGLAAGGIGWLTAAVQLGFIAGTLLLSLSGLADRFAASRIFVVSAIAGALTNLAFAWLAEGVVSGAMLRFATGLALAGIYPVGMKLVVSWAPERRGEALGWLVGMLTIGTASPHLLRALDVTLAWPWVVSAASLLALVGAILIGRLGDGPHLPAPARLSWGAVLRAFHRPGYRAAAFGYFGHMWELYAFWMMVPLLVGGLLSGPNIGARVSWVSFAVIGIGGLGCVIVGRLSRRWGSARSAAALAASGLMCMFYPALQFLPVESLLVLLLIWGFAVVADSAQFSALASRHAPPEAVASALSFLNSVGFFISVLAIVLVAQTWAALGPKIAWLLVPGPILGLLSLRPLLRGRGNLG